VADTRRYLRIDGETWKVPAGVDPDELHKRLLEAIDAGRTEVIWVELGDDPPSQIPLVVNGRAVGTAAVVELPDATIE
jgi:hypothetical protein